MVRRRAFAPSRTMRGELRPSFETRNGALLRMT
jgi:hypothetical protein